MRQILFLTGIVVVFCLNQCSKGPGITRSYGTETEQYRTLPSFHEFVVSQKFRVILTQDTSKPESVTIRYGSHVIDKIQTEVINGVLTISDKNHFNWVRNLNVHPTCTLNVHEIDRMRINGSAEVTCRDTMHVSGINIMLDGIGSQNLLLDCVQVTGNCSNAGNVTMKGHGGLFAWTCENGSWIDAGELQCDDAYVYHYTGRDISVNAGTLLKAYVYGSGNVFYTREPWYNLEKVELGTGKVLKK